MIKRLMDILKIYQKQTEDLERSNLVEKIKITTKITEDEIRKYYTEVLKQEPLLLIDMLIKRLNYLMIKWK